MRLTEFLTRLRHALREEIPGDDDKYAAEHRREQREQTTLNLLSAEVGARRTNYEQQERYYRLTPWTFVVSVLTLFAVGYYALIAQHQRDAVRDQVVEMREANRLAKVAQERTEEAISAADRPWIGAHRIDLDQFGPDQKMIAKAQFLNVGKSPALNVSTISGSYLLPALPTDERQILMPRPPTANVTLLPNMDFFIPFVTARPITKAEFESIRAGGAPYFVVVARVFYRNKIGGPGQTCICAYYDPARGHQAPFTRCLIGQCAAD